MPDVPPGVAMPNPPPHRSACGALSVFVCRANPKAWRSGVLLRASALGAALLRREKRCPCIWYKAVLWFHHLVQWASAGPLRYDGARVEITGIHPGRLLGSSFPWAPLPLTQAVAGRHCQFPMRSSLFVLPPRHSLVLLTRPALRVVLSQSLQVMPYSAGLVNSGRPFTPTTMPAPSGTNARHLVVIAAGRIDSRRAALPRRVTASRRTRPLSCNDISDLVKRDCGVGGRGRPAWDLKSRASSMNDTCP